MDGNTKVKIIHEYQGGKGRSKISAVRDYMPYFYSAQSFPQAHVPHSLLVPLVIFSNVHDSNNKCVTFLSTNPSILHCILHEHEKDCQINQAQQILI